MAEIHRARAPLRIGLGGGGTDLAAYSDNHTGAVLNATVSLYAHATIRPNDSGIAEFAATDLGQQASHPVGEPAPTDELPLHASVHNRMLANGSLPSGMGYRLTTHVDAPPGSGLGSSSTLVVAILGAFAEWLRLPYGEYDVAKLAYDIERVDLGFAGGKQDQYAATFGGFNFMEFHEDRVIVNPLRVKRSYLSEIEHGLMLFHTNVSRVSADIINEQEKRVSSSTTNLAPMHHIRDQAYELKEAILTGQIDQIGRLLNKGMEHKLETAEQIGQGGVLDIYRAALKAGASGGKVSGAGGGGFMIFFIPDDARANVKSCLASQGCEQQSYSFTSEGLESWTVSEAT